jgi:hypothetical protein
LQFIRQQLSSPIDPRYTRLICRGFHSIWVAPAPLAIAAERPVVVPPAPSHQSNCMEFARARESACMRSGTEV